MTVREIAPPAVEPLTLAEVKLWAKIDNDADDDLIERIIIPGVRRQFSSRTQHATTTTEYEYTSDGFPTCGIELWYTPLIAVDSFLYLDAEGMQQMLEAADIYVDTVRRPGRVAPIYDGSWPDTRNDVNAVRIRYRAGYGDDRDSVPENARLWMLVTCSDAYKHRDSMVIGQVVAQLPGRFIDSLLDEFMIPYVI